VEAAKEEAIVTVRRSSKVALRLLRKSSTELICVAHMNWWVKYESSYFEVMQDKEKEKP